MVHGSQNRGSWASWGPTIIFSEKKSPYLNNLSLDHKYNCKELSQENCFTLLCLGRDLQLPWRQGTELRSRVPCSDLVKKHFQHGWNIAGWPAHLGPDQGEGYCKTKAISGWQTTDRLRFESSLTCTSGQRTIDFTKSHSSWTLIVRNCGQNSLKSARIFLPVSGISLVYHIALIDLISNGNLINAWL